MDKTATVPVDPGPHVGGDRALGTDRDLYLLRAAGGLMSSLDRDALAIRAVRLGVPRLGDCCRIDLVDERGDHDRAAMARRDPRTGMLVTSPGAPLGPDRRGARLRIVRPRSRCSLTITLRNRGRTLGSMTFSFDEPSRAHAPEERALARRLARLVAKALGNAQRLREAELAIRARDDLLGAVAHDLRTPLARLYLVAATLDRTATPNQRHGLGVVSRSAQYMSKLVDDLLDVRRLDRTVPLERSLQRIEPILREAVAMAAPSVEKVRGSIVLAIAPGLPAFVADRDRLLQALSNLIENAARSRTVGPEIVVRAELRRRELCLTVGDNGRGIAAADLPHVFDRYWQANRADRRGLGMGLVIARSIAEAHGGRIWVESKVDAGTTLTITLPLDGSADAAPRFAAEGISPPAG